MTTLEAAEQHLQAALTRLENALNRRLAAGANDPSLAAVVEQRDALQAECSRLLDAVQELRRDNERLRHASDDAARGLEQSVAEINRMLEG